ncbi:unnamed protein product [Macrosiphum euphorbiae]|uniref:Nuclease HARBI1 n=1 Tax=Macrosiphum euphorbiae TaxID=13131 RepID=A0AAV0WIV1_9HEMI|nr:unnamed protein product [Macrosiphum euphorbiae]
MTDSDSSNSDDEMVLDVLFYLPRPRFFRDRSNPLEDFDDFDFKSRFRLSKETFVFLLHLIGNDLRRSTNRSFAISPEIQILVTLRYYATGTFQAVIGDHVHVHKSTICRTIKRVSLAIGRLRPHFINMPRDAEEIQKVQTGFFQIERISKSGWGSRLYPHTYTVTKQQYWRKISKSERVFLLQRTGYM